MHVKKWTIEEDEYIKSNFGKITLSEMSHYLNCSISAIQNRAKVLGFEVIKKTARRWTQEEIALLIEMAPKYLNKTIARKLDRSTGEINKKARSLGIKLMFKKPVWKKWKVKFLIENINHISLTQIERELDVSYYQIMDKLSELGLEYTNNNWTEEEEQILIQLAPICYIREIAKVLNRTEGAIMTKAYKMGLEYITLQRNFTEEELDYIKLNWGKIPVTEMARNLKVSRNMVQRQADLMNLPKLGNNPYKKWTEEQLNKLRSMAPNKTIPELAKYFKTTTGAIESVASKHRIKLIDGKVTWTEKENNLLAEYAKTMTLGEIAKNMNKSSSAVRLQAGRLGIKVRQHSSVWTEENSRELIELAKSYTLIEIVKMMGKTDITILKKAKQLGLDIKKDASLEWTKEEVEKLILLSKTRTLNELVLELGRTSSSIKAKALALGITIRASKKNWTKEEYQQLEFLLIEEQKSPKEIAEILGRSEDAVLVKIQRRGLSIGGKGLWTEEEEILLSDLWGSEPIEKIAKKLNRTVSSIRNKAFQLKLGSQIDSNYEGLKITEISELFCVRPELIKIGWVALGLKVKSRKITQSTSYQYVEISDLFDFLEANQNIWNSRVLEKNILGKEPEWLKEKRKRDSEQDPSTERLVLTKQQLILARKFFLELDDDQIQEEKNLVDNEAFQLFLKRGKQN